MIFRAHIALTWILLGACSCSPLFAQDATFVASLDPDRVGAGEQFQLHLTFSGTGTTLPSGLKPPEF